MPNNLEIFTNKRQRRLRVSPGIRDLVRETSLSMDQVILPIFVRFGKDEIRPIRSMPGHSQLTLDHLTKEIKEVHKLGIKSVMLFGIPENKDNLGSDNLDPDGIAARAIKTIKDACPEMVVISDMCLCDYSDHGHCYIVDNKNNAFDTDRTLQYLAKASVNHAMSGSDMIAPSGMVDFMVSAIRKALDESTFNNLPIMSYAVKYASAFYEPFREAAESSARFGDRKSHQLDPANYKEALREARQDIDEGADIILVKPALPYLDIVKTISDNFDSPIAAYHTSGEYAALHAASQKGWLSLEAAALESLTSIKRAGANIIITYFAKDLAKWIN